MSERDDVERLAKIFILNENEAQSREDELMALALAAYRVGRESLRAERAELGSGWRAYETEHKRSLKLIERLRSIAGENLPTEALYKHEKISRKAIAEYEASVKGI